MPSLHQISVTVADITQLIVDLHLLALIFVNVTESPHRAINRNAKGHTNVRRWYRAIEILAGLVTPLAKR